MTRDTSETATEQLCEQAMTEGVTNIEDYHDLPRCHRDAEGAWTLVMNGEEQATMALCHEHRDQWRNHPAVEELRPAPEYDGLGETTNQQVDEHKDNE